MRRPTWGQRLRVLEERMDRQHGRIADLERELTRISPQLAALEQRVEDVRQQMDLPDMEGADADDRAVARQLVEEVRREHARVRARISAATVFEERLRVLEELLQVDSETGRRPQD